MYGVMRARGEKLRERAFKEMEQDVGFGAAKEKERDLAKETTRNEARVKGNKRDSAKGS